METKNSTTPSSDSSATPDASLLSLDLELPVWDLPRSMPPLVTLPEMMRRIRQLREWFPEGIRTPEERWKAKTDVAFIL